MRARFAAFTIARMLLSVLWAVSAIAILVWAALYVAVQQTGPLGSNAIWSYAVPLILLLGVLFYGEGAEVAVAMLSDKDPEQFPDWLRKSFLSLEPHLAKQRHAPYISGRQAIVVFAIVGITILCDQLSTVEGMRGPAWLGNHVSLLADSRARFWFTLLFPTLAALWLAQLPPKFAAHENPLWIFSWQFTRWLLAVSMILGRYARIDSPSLWFANRLATTKRSDIQPLGPGRRFHYQTSAMLRGGRGLQQGHIEIKIHPDGSAAVVETFRYHAFGKGLRRFPQRIFWEQPVPGDPEVHVTAAPPEAGAYAISPFARSQKTFDGTVFHGLEWVVSLQSDLPIHSEFELRFSYRTAPGAMRTAYESQDGYDYAVKLVPTAELIVDAMPSPDASFVLVDGEGKVDAAEDRAVDDFELSRIKITPFKRGYRYEVHYPLFNTTFSFNWSVARELDGRSDQ